MELTKNEHMELHRQATARNGRADSARHARLILLLADGLTWAEIRAKLDCSDSVNLRWRPPLRGRIGCGITLAWAQWGATGSAAVLRFGYLDEWAAGPGHR